MKYNQILKFYIDKLNIIFTSIIGEIDSIILVGSYATKKGEFDNQGKPLSDFDFYIVISGKLKNYKINEWIKEINDYPNPFKTKLDIHIHFLSRKKLASLLPLFRYYDLLHFSKVVYGKDIGHEITNFLETDISIYDGFRYLCGIYYDVLLGEKVSKKKLGMIKQKAEQIKMGCYGKNIKEDLSITMQEYVSFCLNYYKGGYKKASKEYLQSLIELIIKVKYKLKIKIPFILSFLIQVIFTIKWAIKTRNIGTLKDWRDPALRIFYIMIYHFSDNEKDSRLGKAIFKTMSKKEYTPQNIANLFDEYFHDIKSPSRIREIIIK